MHVFVTDLFAHELPRLLAKQICHVSGLSSHWHLALCRKLLSFEFFQHFGAMMRHFTKRSPLLRDCQQSAVV
jgi:hypothetical protein